MLPADWYQTEPAEGVTAERVLLQRRYTWAELQRRVFAIEVFVGPNCGGTRRLLAAIDDPNAIARASRVRGRRNPGQDAPSRCGHTAVLTL